MTAPPQLLLRSIACGALLAATACQGFFALPPREPTATPARPPEARPTTRTRTPDSAAASAPTAVASEPPMPPTEPPDPEPDAAASDSAGVARLVRLAHLWHTVALHHPAVATHGVPWDSALIIAALRVRAAADDEALRSAYQRMLALLRDPSTRVERADRTDPQPIPVTAERTADSISIIRIPTSAPLDRADSATMADAVASLSGRVLIDLRGSGRLDPQAFALQLDDFLLRTGLSDALMNSNLPAPVERTRRIGIWPGAGDKTEAFHDGWQSPAARVYAGRSSMSRAVALLADSGTVLPGVLLALHDAGRASVVADGGLRDASPVSSVRVPLSNGLLAVVRTGDLVHRDGSLGVFADTTLAASSGNGDDTGRMAVLTMLRSGSTLPLAARPLPEIRAMAGAPVFYDTTAYPFMGARLLGGFRLWSAMRTRHAHRDLYEDDIDDVFSRVIPRLEAARSAAEYAKAVAELAASSDDPQGVLRGASADEMEGPAAVPFRVATADGHVYLTDVVRDSTTTALNLVPGTEVTSFDGYPVVAWFYEHRRALPASNDWTRMRGMSRLMSLGSATNVMMKVRDANGRERSITVPRTAAYRAALPSVERSGSSPIRQLVDGISYLDVERVDSAILVSALAPPSAARAVVLDLRGELHVEDTLLLRRLARRPRSLVGRLIQRSITAPCSVSIREAAFACADVRESHAWERTVDTSNVYSGRVVALIDERTQGAMERFALSLEYMSTVTFIGSSSAGSASWTTPLSLPGGLEVGISTQELRRADGGQIQRIGITPQIEVRPTVRGLRTADDEVLARALGWLQQQLDPPVRRRR